MHQHNNNKKGEKMLKIFSNGGLELGLSSFILVNVTFISKHFKMDNYCYSFNSRVLDLESGLDAYFKTVKSFWDSLYKAE